MVARHCDTGDPRASHEAWEIFQALEVVHMYDRRTTRIVVCGEGIAKRYLDPLFFSALKITVWCFEKRVKNSFFEKIFHAVRKLLRTHFLPFTRSGRGLRIKPHLVIFGNNHGFNPYS